MGKFLNMTKPQTSAEKSVLFRKRNADLGRNELRGIFATKDEQVILKKLIRDKIKELRL